MEKVEKPKRIKLIDRTKENDIKYRGPLSYRHLRIFAWIFLAFSQIPNILAVAKFLDPTLVSGWEIFSNISGYVSSLPLPLFILANFSFILRKRDNFKNMLIFYGGIALGLYVAANIIVGYYIFGIFKVMNPTGTFMELSNELGVTLCQLGKSSYSLNLFIDLFLCALTFFFVYYNPKKYFQGKKRIIFRLLVLIPIIYELGSLIIKFYVNTDNLVISHFVFFLLTSKPPFMFLAFLLLTFAIKIGEVKHFRKYKDHYAYKEHTETNAYSLRISLNTTWIFALCGILDIIATLVFVVVFIVARVGPEVTEEEVVLLLNTGVSVAGNMGFGLSASLILTIPFVLLFSFSRTHKNTTFDSFLPLAGIGLIVFTYIQGFYIVFFNYLPFIFNDSDSASDSALLLKATTFVRQAKEHLRSFI